MSCLTNYSDTLYILYNPLKILNLKKKKMFDLGQ